MRDQIHLNPTQPEIEEMEGGPNVRGISYYRRIIFLPFFIELLKLRKHNWLLNKWRKSPEASHVSLKKAQNLVAVILVSKILENNKVRGINFFPLFWLSNYPWSFFFFFFLWDAFAFFLFKYCNKYKKFNNIFYTNWIGKVFSFHIDLLLTLLFYLLVTIDNPSHH